MVQNGPMGVWCPVHTKAMKNDLAYSERVKTEGKIKKDKTEIWGSSLQKSQTANPQARAMTMAVIIQVKNIKKKANGLFSIPKFFRG